MSGYVLKSMKVVPTEAEVVCIAHNTKTDPNMVRGIAGLLEATSEDGLMAISKRIDTGGESTPEERRMLALWILTVGMRCDVAEPKN